MKKFILKYFKKNALPFSEIFKSNYAEAEKEKGSNTCKSRSFRTFSNLIWSRLRPVTAASSVPETRKPRKITRKMYVVSPGKCPCPFLRGYGADELGISLTRIVAFNFKPETLWVHFVRVLNYSAPPHIRSRRVGLEYYGIYVSEADYPSLVANFDLHVASSAIWVCLAKVFFLYFFPSFMFHHFVIFCLNFHV